MTAASLGPSINPWREAFGVLQQCSKIQTLRLLLANYMWERINQHPVYRDIPSLMWPVALDVIRNSPPSVTYLSLIMATNVRPGLQHRSHFARIPWADISRSCHALNELSVVRIEISSVYPQCSRFNWTETRVATVLRHFPQLRYHHRTSFHNTKGDACADFPISGDGEVLVLARSLHHYRSACRNIPGGEIVHDDALQRACPRLAALP